MEIFSKLFLSFNLSIVELFTPTTANGFCSNPNIHTGCCFVAIEWTHKRKNSHYISMIR
ncbi:hypothetical protein D1AOALGA4SA_11968 [Olavius algarvensis Delta 1 endosymbiont]|nr:hypothetical protein D1AOALGA4SA_11968 [Olavius algarvensis Delta 1 endosymbiont]